MTYASWCGFNQERIRDSNKLAKSHNINWWPQWGIWSYSLSITGREINLIIDMKSDTCCDLRTETFSLEVRGLLFIDIVEGLPHALGVEGWVRERSFFAFIDWLFLWQEQETCEKLVHVDVWQKTTTFSKAIILQLKNKFEPIQYCKVISLQLKKFKNK